MPSVYTFEATPVQKQNKVDYKQAREKLASERREVEKALIAYHLRVVGQFDSPFHVQDPRFSLLPATHGLESPSYIGALVPSKFEDRQVEEAKRTKDSELDKSREEEEGQSMREDGGQPRKYRRHGAPKKHTEKRAPRMTGKKPGPKASRNKEETEESNSASGLFSPGP